jgi:2-polyprenyl-3-methyl-5-hydroxy-6-metoxy-1,4-benzoquinol methylase
MPRFPYLNIPDMSERLYATERLEDPAAENSRVIGTVRDWAIINRIFSRSRHLARSIVIEDIRRKHLKKATVLDAGAGGCDFGRWFAGCCRRLGLPVALYCIDNDVRVLSFARGCCRSRTDITICDWSIENLADFPIPLDYIITNNVLHHFDNPAAAQVIRTMHNISRQGFLINDLRRSAMAFVLFSLLSRCFSRDHFTRDDDLTSIRRAFRISEIRALIAESGLANQLKIAPIIPARFCVWCLK